MGNLGQKFVNLAFLAAFVLAGFGVGMETAFAGDRTGPGQTVQAEVEPMKIAAKDPRRDTNTPQPKRWSVTNFIGDVKVRVAKGVAWKPLARATVSIAPGMQVKTGEGGRFSLKQGKDVITVSPNSEIEIPTKGDDNILQTLGKVLFDMERRPDRRFSVGTPYLAATIKGTVFTVTVDALGSTVDVHEGAVQVASLKSNDVTIIRPGQRASVTSRGGGRLTVGKDSPPAKKVKPPKNDPKATTSVDEKAGAQSASLDSKATASDDRKSGKKAGGQLVSLDPKDNSGKGKGRLLRIESTDEKASVQSVSLDSKATASDDRKSGKKAGGQLVSLDPKDNSGKGKGRLLRIESTLGVQRIDIGSVTKGLVANWTPPGNFGNSGNGKDGGSANTSSGGPSNSGPGAYAYSGSPSNSGPGGGGPGGGGPGGGGPGGGDPGGGGPG